MISDIINWKTILTVGIVAALPLIIFSMIIVMNSSQEIVEYERVIINETDYSMIVDGEKTTTSHVEYDYIPVTPYEKYLKGFMNFYTMWLIVIFGIVSMIVIVVDWR